jgi:hypothetical protein
MKLVTSLLLLFAFTATVSGQKVINGSRSIKGTWDASASAGTKPVKSVTSLPGTCSAPQKVVLTTAAARLQNYTCGPDNTWTLDGGVGTRSITLMDPVIGDDGRVQIQFPTAVTIVRLSCSVNAATSVSINLDERAAATPDTEGTLVLGSALVCVTNEASTASFSNATVAPRVPLALRVTAVSGTPATLRVHIEYTVD